MLRKQTWVCAAALALSLPVWAACEDPQAVVDGEYVAVNESMPDIVRAIAQPRGWQVESNLPPGAAGPRIHGRLRYAHLADAVYNLDVAMRRMGWEALTQIDRSTCVIRIAFADKQLAGLATVQASRQPAQASAAAGVSPSAVAAADGDNPKSEGTSAPAVWRLRGGERLGAQLSEWLQQAGWQMVWKLDVDWVVPSDVEVGRGDVLQALDRVAKWLAQEGRPVQLTAYDINRVVVAAPLDAASHNR